ncbi:substrate-binding domain-containing protein [Chitinophaga pendula]|uniref:molybdate ABC transporter substrate-binding protein n=1 Tax=Chitinophaga TaxID=79328 RepID=UPI000BAEDC06|nr:MULTISPECIES: substrate-binding domain-containing protein [Chitinophaga]ASZ11919.1 sulfate-binding protein [Chitinophaga sp. MD30]UCJ05053.1 substrate-binding domain-containing protein [Chitinophaga pendula]
MKKIFLSIPLCIITATTTYGQQHHFDPPWNKPPESAVHFTVPGVDNIPDLFGDINNPDLVIFFGGNQFMVIDELIAAFKQTYPAYKKVFVETLPPGILAKQIAGGALTIGNMRIDLKPDIYTAGEGRIAQTPEWFSQTTVYAKNRLALLVPKGNPKNIQKLTDLATAGVKISMPNPEWEGIGKRIEEAYIKAGGQHLRNTVMQTKVADSTTYLTYIHHRQSPMRILYGQSDVAPVWYTEAQYQQSIGHPVDMIEIPAAENIEAKAVAALLKNAPHKKAAADFMQFLVSPTAKAIFKKYGFITT